MPTLINQVLEMFRKALFATVSAQAARLLMSEKGLAPAELEKRVKVLLQNALSKLDVVSREEFDTQQAILMRTRERLEALEKRVDALENKPPTSPDA